MEKVIKIRFKSGYECSHTPNVDSEDEWWKMIQAIIAELNRPQAGLFLSTSPYGIHKLTDVEAIHFGDSVPPEGSAIPKIGFLKE